MAPEDGDRAQPKFRVRPMPVGAEIVDLEPGAENDPASRAALYQAWLQYGILLFRNIDSVDRHVAISRCFGELEKHPVPEIRHPDNPYLIELGGPRVPSAYMFDDKDLRVNRVYWHRDTAYTPDICKGAMLRMLEVPAHEGETMLADTAMAYDDLPVDMKARLETLEHKSTLRSDPLSLTGHAGIWWETVRGATEEEVPGSEAKRLRDSVIDGRYPSVIHPAVLTHPESGRKCIFLSPTYVDCFIGLDEAESDKLLRWLTDFMLQPKYVYKHKWGPNDAIVWDNRRFMHAGAGNLPNEPRYGLRTTLVGSIRTGRYFDNDAKAPDFLLAD